ncbi:acyl-CoA dehydrogenase [Gordonia sp. ABSL49_1]|uniref:acyl-CoA dehydrogenase n=1 Tax=unclassified Gordonia (in: high G+C Gram-positive bacteria) TaxID=2657482 RepID=UPI001F1066AB|nr:acyl-CoA dehydrogenase [Gordonia sp. ABSL49_1]MCH5645191.1 acyl-CoA dehydrogenase family protein [Gordonia sp. ABSL49_1]
MIIATSEEQKAVCHAIADWAQRVDVTERVRSDLDKPRDQWADLMPQLAEFGVFGAAVAEDRGGLGAQFADVAAMLEQCGTSLVPGPLVPTIAASIALSRSSDPRSAAIVDELVSGRRAAVTPVSAFSGSAAPELADGELDLGLVAGFVDGCVVLTPLDVAGRSGWWVIPSGIGIAEVIPQNPVDGAASVSRVRISGLTASDVVGLHDADLVDGVLSAALAAYQSGVARWCLTTAVEYAKTRTQFGVAIGSFQAIKHICAEMLCRSEQITAVAWDLAGAVDVALSGDDEGFRQLAVSRLAADAIVAQASVANAKDCVQILGGIGFTFEHDAHLYLRSAIAAQVALGHGVRQQQQLAVRGLAGDRRRFALDLSAVEHRRDEVRSAVADIAAADPDDQRRLLAESGYLTPHWPPPFGLGADAALQLLIDAEFENAEVDRPDLVIAGWAIPTILEHGTSQQRDRFVGPTLAGDIVWCQLFSEPEAGSDLAALRTRAERVDGGWRLTGQKIWTSQAHNAQWGICLARTDSDAPKHKGITYFLVDMSTPGIDIRPLRELTGRANFNEVFLDDVVVPDDCVVGEVNGGWRLARTTLANERVAMGGSGLGKEMESLLAQVADRDLTDGDLAAVGEMVADAHVGRVLDARAVTERLAGHDPGALSSVRKLIGVAHRQAVPELALRLLGDEALAATDASDLLLQNRCLSIAGGTTQILRTAAAERILGLPRG